MSLEGLTDRKGRVESPESQLYLGKKFSISGSFGPDSPEVKTIEQARLNGQPIHVYELVQGMVDYGRDHMPPPRILIHYQSGLTRIFDGTKLEKNTEDPVVGIEFTNGGQGMTPEDAVINRHGGDDKTDGKYGKGLTLALCSLVDRGMPVRVSSHFMNRRWSGNVLLEPTETGITKILKNDGKWGELLEASAGITSVCVENPTDEFIDEFNQVPDYYLHANPKFPDAVVVPHQKTDIDFETRTVPVDEGEIMCLDGVVDGKNSYDVIYVDGLALRIQGDGKTFFPWGAKGLRDPMNCRFRLNRAHDSEHVEGWSVPLPIAAAARNLKDKELLRKLIHGTANSDIKFFELLDCAKEAGCEVNFSEETLKLIGEIWEEDFGGRPIAYYFLQIERARHYGLCESGAEVVSIYLYNFLEKAGMPTVIGIIYKHENKLREAERNRLVELERENTRLREEQEKKRAEEEEKRNADRGLLDSYSMDRLPPLSVSFARSEDKLEQLMKRLAAESADVTITEFQGKKCLQIKFPFSIKDVHQFTGQTENFAGVAVRIAAIVAYTEKIGCRIVTVEPEVLHQISIDVQEGGCYEGEFFTPAETEVLDRTKHPDFASFDAGCTYVLLDGEAIDGMREYSYMERLLENFAAALEEIVEKMQRAPKLKTKKKRLVKNELEVKPAEQISSPVIVSSVGKENLGQNTDILRNGGESTVTTVKETREVITEHSEVPPGYYRTTVGTRFCFNEGEKRVHWEGTESWKSVEIPQKAPNGEVQCSSKIVLTNIDGECKLPVKNGDRIICYATSEKGQVEFFREERTGIYKVRGKARLLVFFTLRENNVSFETAAPVPEESDDFVDTDLLLPDWQEFIRQVKENPAFSVFNKIGLAQEKWAQVFHYSDDPGLDDQMKGDSAQICASKILNTARGICNVSASGFALLLRTLGIPSRVCGGEWVQGGGHGGSHLWVEYWNGSHWIAIESQIGVENEPSVKRTSDDVRRKITIVSPDVRMLEFEVALAEATSALQSVKRVKQKGGPPVDPNSPDVVAELKEKSRAGSVPAASQEDGAAEEDGEAGFDYDVDKLVKSFGDLMRGILLSQSAGDRLIYTEVADYLILILRNLQASRDLGGHISSLPMPKAPSAATAPITKVSSALKATLRFVKRVFNAPAARRPVTDNTSEAMNASVNSGKK